MYETKIPGTRYICALASIKGQWLIQIKLDNIVEAQAVVKDLSERGIRDNINTVLSEVSLYLNDFIVEQITKDITNQARILLQEVEATSSAKQGENSSSNDFSEKFEKIMERIELLEQRVNRLEKLSDRQ